MLILSVLPNPLHCQPITGKLAIAGLFNASWFSSAPENRPMGTDVVSVNPGDRSFRLIQSQSHSEIYIDSGRSRHKPEPT